MSTAIFGISNSGLNLVVTLFLLMIVVVWLALIVYTYLDAKRRIDDPFLVACATVGSFFPYIGTAVYAIVRPPEFLEDARERQLEIKAAELRVRQLTELSCPGCEYPVEKTFLRCPECQRRLKDPCQSCGKPVDPRWAVCPYCETAIAQRARERPQRREQPGRSERARDSQPERKRRDPEPEQRPDSKREPRREAQPGDAEERRAPKRQPTARQKEAADQPPPKRTKRSPKREPDPDPRQA